MLQLLPAPHMLIVHILDLRFDALELGVELRETGRERERVRRRAVTRCSVVADELVDSLRLGCP